MYTFRIETVTFTRNQTCKYYEEQLTESEHIYDRLEPSKYTYIYASLCP